MGHVLGIGSDGLCVGHAVSGKERKSEAVSTVEYSVYSGIKWMMISETCK